MKIPTLFREYIWLVQTIYRARAITLAEINERWTRTEMSGGVKPEFLQEYLNEFCYKFNRRYFGEDLFDRLVMIAASYRTDFEHRTYRKVA